MPNFGDTAQENTSGVSEGDEWPVVFLFVCLFFFLWFGVACVASGIPWILKVFSLVHRTRTNNSTSFEQSELEGTNVIYLQ